MAGVKGRSGRPPNERLWRAVLTERANKVTSQGRREIEELADALWARAKEGDVSALKEIGDRLDGKAAQQHTVAGDEEGGPVRIEFGWATEKSE